MFLSKLIISELGITTTMFTTMFSIILSASTQYFYLPPSEIVNYNRCALFAYDERL